MTDAALPSAGLTANLPTQPPLTLEAKLEALLFVAPGAVTPTQLAVALDLPLEEVEAGLTELEEQYAMQAGQRGLHLQRYRGKVQLTTPPAAALLIERFLGLEISGRLSRAALETLAIVMYRQPVTRPQVDAIRGVNSDGVLKSLLLRGLVEEVGRLEAPGRPILYSVTSECLQYFGLDKLSDLPPLDLDEYFPDSLAGSPPAAGLQDILKG